MEDMLSKRIDPLVYIDNILLQEGKRFTLKELNDDLKKYGLYVKSDTVYHRKSRIMLADVSSSTSELLKYNFRLTKAMDYGYSTSEGKEILANRFHVEVKDIPDKVRDVNTDYYRAIMQNAINSGNERAFLNDCNMSMVQNGDSSFIIDDESNVIIDVDSLELERGFYRVGKLSQPEDNIDLMDNVLEILGAEDIAEGGGVGEAPKRKKGDSSIFFYKILLTLRA